MIDEPELLTAMLADEQKQAPMYAPGPFWIQPAARTADAIIRNGLTSFRSDAAIGRDYAGVVVLDPSALWNPRRLRSRLAKWLVGRSVVKSTIMDRYLTLIKRYFEQALLYRSYYYEREHGAWLADMAAARGLPDTLIGDPLDVITVNGHDISVFSLYHLSRINNFAQSVDFHTVKTVFEIGGGGGFTAHYLMHLFPNITRYLYVDIPPMLYVGTQYLKHFYGSAVLDYGHTRNMEVIDFTGAQRQIICICPWQLPQVDAQADLFWNSASFQEMDSSAVSAYASHVARLTSQHAALCLYVYGEKPGQTLSAEEVVGSFGNSFQFQELSPRIRETRLHTRSSLPEDTKYLLGMRVERHVSSGPEQRA